MTLLQRINADYEAHLEEHWTKDGERKQDVTRHCDASVLKQMQEQINWAAYPRLNTRLNNWLNTKEICGND